MLQREVDDYISQFEVGYFKPMTLVVRLAEELGELAREVNHSYGEKPKKATEPDGDIALELGDLLFVLICLANSLGIDLTEAHDAVIEKFQTRDRDRFTRKQSLQSENN
ncbi:nucleotide pyrophosphohydrolase [Sulfoacidibacillus thermotolerans]|uniref:Nucleotide pyrophosphohydrolase n=1 Tax=Sulfoacidibacillus thermotolerans TaxID=1765684 RepID=A0A2U3D741_SULT2|nr:nucleotide pyrophosphohydrolase [Sulfoacidibacillus thermotolerans]PWI57096.1 nucleotide pyrophosphohydrolase [Sulfoacidibacillus thermotolerans]